MIIAPYLFAVAGIVAVGSIGWTIFCGWERILVVLLGEDE